MNWRDIHEPDGVARLPRTAGGLPVPYVAAWSSEERTRFDFDPRLVAAGIDGRAHYTEGGIGQGRPILGEMNPPRARECALEQLCQVCSGPANPKARRVQDGAGGWAHPLLLADVRTYSTAGDVDFGGAAIRIGRKLVPLIFEPWVCVPCMRYALLVCPGLIRRSGQPTPGERFFRPLRILRVRGALPVAVTSFSDQHPAEPAAVSFVKLAVTDYRPEPPERFLAATGGIPASWRPPRREEVKAYA